MNKIIVEDIEQEIKSVQTILESAKKGEGSTIYLQKDEQKQYVLSKYNPKESAKKLIEGQSFNKQTLWIIVGFMFGYPIEEIVEKVGLEAKIIIVEPNIEFLQEQLKSFNNEKFTGSSSIHVVGGVAFEEIRGVYEQLIDASNYHNINLIVPAAYQKMYPQYCKKLVKTVSAILNKEIINQNTAKAIYGQIIRNNILNRKAMLESYDLKEHHEKYKDIPAVIVSAGPSLDKNIEYLKGFNGFIFTMGRTLGAVLDQGITPDFTALIDSSDIIYDTFKKGRDSEIPLLSSTQGCYKVVEANNGPKYFIENASYVTRDLLGIDLVSLPMAGTVATLCLATATYMGCNPIIFIGQDLAYTNMQTHAVSTQVFDKEKENKIQYNIKYIPGYYGEDVPSSADLISFLNWIEGFIKNNPQTTYINATEGGAAIEGTIQKPLKEVVTEYNCKEKVNVIHKVHIQQPTIKVEEHINELLEELHKFQKITKLGKSIASELLEEFTLYHGKRKHKIQQLSEKLDHQVDEKIKSYQKRESLTEVFGAAYNEVMMTEVYQEKLNETQEEKKKRIAKLSIELYKSLEESSSKLIYEIENALKETTEE